MRNLPILLLTALLLFLFSCAKTGDEQSEAERIPKVLFITSGNDQGIGELAPGVSLAQRFFCSKGMLMSIQTREILLDAEALANYDLIIASTARNYHDADRLYSLSFLSDIEMHILKNWVEEGGFLLAGDNFGRNYLGGGDRITDFSILTEQNWPLAEVFGLRLKERNMKGYRIESGPEEPDTISNLYMEQASYDMWSLICDTLLDDQSDVWAFWTNDSLSFPAIVQHRFGKGNAMLLASSLFLHPVNDGGFSGISQIEALYSKVSEALTPGHIKIRLNPWPAAYSTAFSLGIMHDANSDYAQGLISFVEENDLPATIFSKEDLKQLHEYSLVEVSGTSQDLRFRDLSYSETLTQILSVNRLNNKGQKGYRFPDHEQSYWGLHVLDQNGYQYESTIQSDWLADVRGALFPYHIPVSSRGYFEILDILELSPMLYDDKYFLGDFEADQNPVLLYKRSLLQSAYWQRYHSEIVLPYKGMMVLTVHPGITFLNDSTLFPLTNLIDTLRNNDKTWFTNLNELAQWWNKIEQFSFYQSNSGNITRIVISAPDSLELNQLSFELNGKPRSVESSIGKANLVEKAGSYYVVMKGIDRQELRIRWD